jgi:hypothetical protein
MNTDRWNMDQGYGDMEAGWLEKERSRLSRERQWLNMG